MWSVKEYIRVNYGGAEGTKLVYSEPLIAFSVVNGGTTEIVIDNNSQSVKGHLIHNFTIIDTAAAPGVGTITNRNNNEVVFNRPGGGVPTVLGLFNYVTDGSRISLVASRVDLFFQITYQKIRLVRA